MMETRFPCLRRLDEWHQLHSAVQLPCRGVIQSRFGLV